MSKVEALHRKVTVRFQTVDRIRAVTRLVRKQEWFDEPGRLVLHTADGRTETFLLDSVVRITDGPADSQAQKG